MSKHSRRSFSTEQKVAILRRHLVDKVPVSDLCEEYKLQPSVLYSWQNLLSAPPGGRLRPAAFSCRDHVPRSIRPNVPSRPSSRSRLPSCW